MKKLIYCFALLLCSGLSAQSDSSTGSKKQIPSSAQLVLANGSMARGWLYNMNDSQVVLLHATHKELRQLKDAPEKWNDRLSAFPVTGIKSIAVKKKNAVAKSALIGLGIGVVTGVAIGLASGDDKVMGYPSQSNDPFGFSSLGVAINNAFAMTAGEKATLGGVLLGCTGAITGAIIGAVAKKKFTIGGKKEKFRDLESQLRRRLLVNE